MQMLDLEISSVLGKYKSLGEARAPALVAGKSGVQHSFSFALGGRNSQDIVGDVIVGQEDEDETKVLSLFIKVYDVGAKRALLCVSPRLTPEALKLARLYNILTIETPDPKQIPRMLEDVLKRLAGKP
jgi:hypothetical protein